MSGSEGSTTAEDLARLLASIRCATAAVDATARLADMTDDRAEVLALLSALTGMERTFARAVATARMALASLGAIDAAALEDALATAFAAFGRSGTVMAAINAREGTG